MKPSKLKVLVTGGAGFIGSAFVRQTTLPFSKLSIIDKLTYAGDRKRLQHVTKEMSFFRGDIKSKPFIDKIFKTLKPDIVIHFAAETHVDRSLKDIQPFLETNVSGTQILIDAGLKYKCKKFIHISTDEVYGANKGRKFTEKSPIQPTNPYASTKAAAEHLIQTAIQCYDFPAIIIRPCNIFGPWQHPEKLIPLAIYRALKKQSIPVYAKGRQKRQWMYVDDCITAIDHIIKKGKIGEAYNISSTFETENIQTINEILNLTKGSKQLIKFVKDRPGHDFKYSISNQKIRQLGWKPLISFKKGLKLTVEWNKNNTNWIQSKLT